jgi:hypothetical protein
MNINKSKLAKLLMASVLLSLLQASTTPIWAADCAKKSDAKLPACVAATAKPGAGSQMQTVPQDSVGEQKRAAQAFIDTKTATSSQKPSREKRNWVGVTQLECKKGSMSLHLAAPATQCPPGFKKS